MQPHSGRPPEANAEPMLPPATTQWQPLARPTDESPRPLAPFRHPAAAEAAEAVEAVGAAEAAPSAPESMPWELPVPAGLEPAPAVTEPWTEETLEPAPDFPLDAFFLPEEPAPPEVPAAADALAESVAGRLEALAARLRESGFDALLAPGSGEPVDAVIAAVLSGYLARAR